jgi:hypothetical protein
MKSRLLITGENLDKTAESIQLLNQPLTLRVCLPADKDDKMNSKIDYYGNASLRKIAMDCD